MSKSIILFMMFFLAVSCSSTARVEKKEAEKKVSEPKTTATVKAEPSAEKSPGDASGATKKTEILPPKSECLNVESGDYAVLEKQTFPIDFEPFRTSCFVTTYNPEFDDPPMESEISIYTDGKKVFGFPDQFNGVTVGCWVTGVAFQDLNNDNLTDIIVAGMCSAKSSPYSENTVYVNTGKGFTTNIDANYKLENFKKIAEIEKFVKANQSLFF